MNEKAKPSVLLNVENLKVFFKTLDGIVPAVNDISFSIEKCEMLGIVGESGSGKSVTVLSLLGLLPESSTEISCRTLQFNGRDISAIPPDEWAKIRGKEIGFVFQEPRSSFNPVYRIGFQIEEAITVHHPDLSQKEASERVIDLLKRVGFSNPQNTYERYPHELSGGMLQRAMIAMAISCHPKLLIADEPTSSLDMTTQAQILRLIQELQNEFNMAVILITHDFGVVSKMADRVGVMYAGQLVELSSKDSLMQKPDHPYTKGLLKCVPSLIGRVPRGERFETLARSTNREQYSLAGCRFHDRCHSVQDKCCREVPVLETKSSNHLVRCFEVK